MTSRLKVNKPADLRNCKVNAKVQKVAVTDEEIERALMNSAGIYEGASQWLRNNNDSAITGEAIRLRVTKSEHLMEVKKIAERRVGDVAEKNVVNAILNGDVKASEWYLERKEKARGYSTKVENEITNAAGQVLKINHEFDDIPTRELAKMTREAFKK